MRISQEIIAQVQERVEIADIVGDFVTLKKKGQNLWACCPFHHEKTPSFSVAPAKGIYKCFGCGKAGDSIQFIMDIESLDFLDAIKFLAQKYGIEIPEEEEEADPAVQQAYNEKESMMIALNFAVKYFQELLWKDAAGRAIGLSYFKERGFSDAIINTFELGYSVQAWDGLLKAAQDKGFSPEILEKAGLIIQKEGKQYDRFRDRVIFPIHNISGKAIAFGARTLSKDKKQPKYLNSPETPVYHKSDVLYGIYQAKQTMRQEDHCYLVEGYTDVISLHLSGVANVVAASGTSLTENQIRLISRFSKNVTVLFDGDSAGLKAALRGVDLILAGNLNVKVVVFPEGEDPDSYSKKLGSTAFKAYLRENSRDFITFKAELLAKEAVNDPIRKAETIKEIVSSIGKIPDAVKRAVYLKECSVVLDIEESVLIAEQNKLEIGQRHKAVKEEQRGETEIADLEGLLKKEQQYDPGSQLAHQERESIRLLLNYGVSNLEEGYKVCDMLFQELEEITFQTPVYSEILELFKTELQKGQVPDVDFYARLNNEKIKAAVFELVADRYELSENWEKKFKILVGRETDNLRDSVFSNVLRLKHRSILLMIEESRQKLKNCKDEAEINHILQTQMQLNEVKKTLSEHLGMVIQR